MIINTYGRKTFEFDCSTRSPYCPIRPKYLFMDCSDIEYELIFKRVMPVRLDLRKQYMFIMDYKKYFQVNGCSLGKFRSQ